MNAVTIPVMAKARIGHFAEAQILEAIGVDMIDESEGKVMWGAVDKVRLFRYLERVACYSLVVNYSHVSERKLKIVTQAFSLSIPLLKVHLV